MTVGKSLKGCKGVGAAGWWGFIGYNYRPGPKPWEAGYHLLPTPNGYQTRSKDTPCSKVVVMVGMVGSVVLVVLVVGYDGFDTNYCLPGTRNGNQKKTEEAKIC